MNNDCIIIGNGSTLLNKKHGDIIDQFKEVVRFNAFTIESYQEFIGTKTTIWFNVVNFGNKSEEWRMNIPYNKIFLPEQSTWISILPCSICLTEL